MHIIQKVLSLLLATEQSRRTPCPGLARQSLSAGNYMDRSTAFKNSTTFFMASSSVDTVFSQAVRDLIPNSFACEENYKK